MGLDYISSREGVVGDVEFLLGAEWRDGYGGRWTMKSKLLPWKSLFTNHPPPRWLLSNMSVTPSTTAHYRSELVDSLVSTLSHLWQITSDHTYWRQTERTHHYKCVCVLVTVCVYMPLCVSWGAWPGGYVDAMFVSIACRCVYMHVCFEKFAEAYEELLPICLIIEWQEAQERCASLVQLAPQGFKVDGISILKPLLLRSVRGERRWSGSKPGWFKTRSSSYFQLLLISLNCVVQIGSQGLPVSLHHTTARTNRKQS